MNRTKIGGSRASKNTSFPTRFDGGLFPSESVKL